MARKGGSCRTRGSGNDAVKRTRGSGQDAGKRTQGLGKGVGKYPNGRRKTGKGVGKRRSGREKTLKERGLQRVPSARDLFAKDLRKELPLYSNRRVRRKQSFWSLQTLQARFRDLCDKDMAMWKARAKKAKEDRKRLIRDRPTATCGVGPTPDVTVAPTSASKFVEGATAA